MKKKQLTIIKIGSEVINDETILNTFLKDFSLVKGCKILVHGGGKSATKLSERLGIKPQIINGRRVTNEATLKVVTMVYSGLLNKKIVATLQKYHCNSIGLSGADANCISANKRIVKDINYGFVGDIDKINVKNISVFLNENITPVFCSITHNEKGQLLNTNADTISSELAIAFSGVFEVSLLYVFGKKGVLKNVNDESSVIKHLDLETYETLKKEKIISEGMLPKLENCFNALGKGVSEIKIGDSNLLNCKIKTYTRLK